MTNKYPEPFVPCDLDLRDVPIPIEMPSPSWRSCQFGIQHRRSSERTPPTDVAKEHGTRCSRPA